MAMALVTFLALGGVLGACSPAATPPPPQATTVLPMSTPQAQISQRARPTLPVPEGTPTPEPTALLELTPMPTPIPGKLAENVVVIERQYMANDQLFGQGGLGIEVLLENRNFMPVDVVLQGILYDGDRVALELPGGPFTMEPRQTLLVPLPADPSVRVTQFDVKIVSVTAHR